MARLQRSAATAARPTAPVVPPGQGARETTKAQQHASATPERELKIRELAYGYFEERGCAEGHALDDWLKAEQQVATVTPGDGGTRAEH